MARTETSGAQAAPLVRELSARLAATGVSDAPREAADIVAAILDEPRFWTAVNGDAMIAPEHAAAMRAAAAKRAAGTPFAYAVGRAAFRHLTLLVDERVLIPRAETEQLVQEVLNEMVQTPGGTAVDLGTGSGAIALSLAQEGHFDRVIATDISTAALEVARANAERRAPSAERPPVELRAGSWFTPLQGVTARVIVANPPYIAHDEARDLPPSVRDWEPAVALYSGDTGMKDIAYIIHGAPPVLEPGGLLALEVDSRRASLAAELALADGRYRDVAVRLDLTGRERILLARLRRE